jgi:hypothetical protein
MRIMSDSIVMLVELISRFHMTAIGWSVDRSVGWLVSCVVREEKWKWEAVSLGTGGIG